MYAGFHSLPPFGNFCLGRGKGGRRKGRKEEGEEGAVSPIPHSERKGGEERKGRKYILTRRLVFSPLFFRGSSPVMNANTHSAFRPLR